MQITMISSLPPIKGISKYTAALLRGFPSDQPIEAMGFKQLYPDVLYPGGSRDASLKPIDLPNVTVHEYLAWYNPFGWLWAGLRLRGDVVHIQYWIYLLAPVYAVILFVAKYLRHKPVVVTLHNVKPHESGKLKDWAFRLMLALGDHFIVHSQANKQMLLDISKVKEEQVSVIAHGVLEPDAPRTGMTMAAARQQLGLPNEAKVILFFGIIRDYKGLDILLQATAKVRQQVPQVCLVIAGKPWQDWQHYQQIIDQNNLAEAVQTHLEFIPEGDIERYFAAADVAAMPYRHFDAQSGAGSLALSFGKAMVVSDTGSLPDLVKSEQAVSKAGDADDLAAKLTAVLQDDTLRRQLEADTQAVATQLDWHTIARQTMAVYEELLARKHR